jgi:hypothetical protein
MIFAVSPPLYTFKPPIPPILPSPMETAIILPDWMGGKGGVQQSKKCARPCYTSTRLPFAHALIL